MRIAILNRQREAYPGGDLVQIDATVEALRKHGVEAVYAPEGWTLDWLRSFDLVHVFHVNFGWSKYNFNRVQESGMKYVVTPIFYPTRDLGMNGEEMLEALAGSEAVLVHSPREWQDIYDCFTSPVVDNINLLSILSKKLKDFVPNGTDTSLFHPPIQGRPPIGRNYVACVTARAGDKNERLVEEQCRLLDIPYRCIIGVKRPELAAILREQVKLFVNASDSERMSLTIGEALCSGCRVLATNQNRGNTWYGAGLATIPCSPVNTNKLRGAIAEAYWAREDEWIWDPNNKASLLTWDVVAEKIAKIYKEVR